MIPAVYILLPAHNRRLVTERVIDCLVAQTFTNYHLLLIDDGSVDGTEEMVRAKIKSLSVLKGQGDWWWAGSLQQGIDWLKQHAVVDHTIIVFMNDDITYERNFLQTAINILDKRKETLLLPQLLAEDTGQPQESGVEVDLKKLTFEIARTPERINCLSTRGLFMRMSELRRVGDFYPRMLPHYLSDYEFTIRARKKGLCLITTPELFIQVDQQQTGYRSFDRLKFIEFVRRYFSNRSASNPLHWTAFILLATPKLYVPKNVLKIWMTTAILICRQALRALSARGIKDRGN